MRAHETGEIGARIAALEKAAAESAMKAMTFVGVESGVPKGVDPLRPFGAQKILEDKIGQDLAGEELGEPRVVEPWDLMEDARLVHSALDGGT